MEWELASQTSHQPPLKVIHYRMMCDIKCTKKVVLNWREMVVVARESKWEHQLGQRVLERLLFSRNTRLIFLLLIIVLQH